MPTASNGIPLTVIAGIPKDMEGAVREKLIRHYRHRDGHALRDFAFVSGLKEGGEYRAHTISKSLEALSERIHARRSRRERLNISKCEGKQCEDCAQPQKKPRPVDSRGLCFSSSARDGSPFGADTIWNRLRKAKTTAEKIFYSEIFFGAYYRFGAPILPGTHFDVQYPGSRKITGETFDCPQHGKMPRFNRRYVNMYPNGVINAPKEPSKKEKKAGDEGPKA